MTNNTSGVVEFSLGPGICHVCPKCLRWIALRFELTRTEKCTGEVTTYVCRHCGGKTEFSDCRYEGPYCV